MLDLLLGLTSSGLHPFIGMLAFPKTCLPMSFVKYILHRILLPALFEESLHQSCALVCEYALSDLYTYSLLNLHHHLTDVIMRATHVSKNAVLSCINSILWLWKCFRSDATSSSGWKGCGFIAVPLPVLRKEIQLPSAPECTRGLNCSYDSQSSRLSLSLIYVARNKNFY